MMPDIKKRNLFDIGDDLDAIAKLIESCDGDISDPAAESAITAWMAEFNAELAKKADSYINLIRKWESEKAAATAEKEQYQKAAAVRTIRVERLKSFLFNFMELTNRTRIETETCRVVSIQCNGGKQPIKLDEEKICSAIRNSSTSVSAPGYSSVIPFLKVNIDIDNDKVRQHLEAGNTLPWAELQERGKGLRIR